MIQVQRVLCRVVGSCCLAVLTPASAQQPPDAGSLLREQPKVAQPPVQARPAAAAAAAPAQAPGPVGPAVTVQAFRIVGSTLFPQAELQARLADLLGQSLDLVQLRQAAARIAAHYQAQGYVVRAFLPAQEIQAGVVEIQVLEARLGEVRVEGAPEGLAPERAAGYVLARQQAGDFLRMQALTAATMILDEAPGVAARLTVEPGAREGRSDVLLRLSAEPRFTGSAQLDNHASNGTGRAQAGGHLSWNNPFVQLDQAGATFNVSEGMRYGRLDYNVPLDRQGLRVNLDHSRLVYELTHPAFATLHGQGNANSSGVELSYPLAREESGQLTLSAGLRHQATQDFANFTEVSAKRLRSLSVALRGDHADPRGASQYGLVFSTGTLDLSANAGNQAADAASARSAGEFSKLNLHLSRQQPLGGDWTLGVQFAAQVSDKNLASSEQMSLGGPAGVRAYPAGEASGDQAWLLNVELRHALDTPWAASAFLDLGGVRQHHDTWAGWNVGNPGLANQYRLKGAGLGLAGQVGPVRLNAALAWKLGSNAGRSAAGLDADGHASRLRAWLQLETVF